MLLATDSNLRHMTNPFPCGVGNSRLEASRSEGRNPAACRATMEEDDEAVPAAWVEVTDGALCMSHHSSAPSVVPTINDAACDDTLF